MKMTMTTTTTNTSSPNEHELRARFDAAGQGHVFQYWDDLTLEERTALLHQLMSFDVEPLSGFLNAARQTESTTTGTDAIIAPFSKTVAPSSDCDDAVGMEAIHQGSVAALVLAGGQGTRLGFDGPKGMYDIGLQSGKTLFQLLAERLVKLSPTIPLYVMTSPLNHEETMRFFEQNHNFGLNSVTCFPQGMLPCLFDDGTIIMESKSSVAMAPDGNGGIYPALVNSGMIQKMTHHGIQYLHVFSIDNALIKPADPIFIGYCISQQADCGNKVVWKAHAHEKVGVLAERNGHSCIVEYSEITKEMAERTDSQGRLEFGAANICNHFYTLDFIQNVIVPTMGHMYHIARKKIPYFNGHSTVSPTSENGLKLESFIFDVFPMSKSMAVMDVERSEEFAPVKNATGPDSPETACAMMTARSKAWVIKAGGQFSQSDEGDVEISPLTSYSGNDLGPLVQGKVFQYPLLL